MSYISFKPYRGLETDILAKPYSDGYVYFATDTKRIFMDANGQAKLPMGGNSGIHYGKKQHGDNVNKDQKIFDFSVNYDIEKRSIPNVNDLILNIPDGCFYRVNSVRKENGDTIVNATKLTIAGGSGSGSGSADTLAGVEVEQITPYFITTLYNRECNLRFFVKATNKKGEITPGVGRCSLLINGVEQKDAEQSIYNNEENSIEISKYLKSETNEVTIILYMDIGTGTPERYPVTWMVTATDFKLSWDNYENNSIHNIVEDYTIDWAISGSSTIKKETKIFIDEIELPVQQPCVFNPKEYGLTHGSHVIKIESTAIFDDNNREPADPIIKSVIFYDENNTSTIIDCGFFEEELTQYNTVSIPIRIYNSTNIGTLDVNLYENGTYKDTLYLANGETGYWAYTPVLEGINTLIIQATGAVNDKVLSVNVNSLDIDNKEVANYAFKFKASDFSSNNAIQNWNSNGVTAKFDGVSGDFDWINGGLKTVREDGNNRQCVYIKAGSTMTINYPLFKIAPQSTGKTFKIIFKTTKCRDYDAEFLTCKNDQYVIKIDKTNYEFLTIPNNTEIEYSKFVGINDNNEKIILQGKKINYDLTKEGTRKLLTQKYISYNNNIYYCDKIEENENVYIAYYYNTNIVDSFAGLIMQAQQTYYNSKNTFITVPYCEDQYIEFEVDISPYDSNGKMYIKTWMDGIPSSIQNYTLNDDFTQMRPSNIIIGSLDCDVQIYLIKAYEKHLTDDEHLANFIADAPNAEEMVARFRRNDILYDINGRKEISPTKLAAANPKCKVHTYSIPRMTTSKEDPVAGCTYAQYQGKTTADLSSNDVTIKVQGTSSASYGLAAYNIDSNFAPDEKTNKCTLVDKDGNSLPDGWAMTENSIPCTYFTTKVNVASVEQANNALNQEWYNAFQPYKSVLRCKNEKARDCMEFTPGVLFIEDHNQTFNDNTLSKNNVFQSTNSTWNTLYKDNPYPKLYSICNMGNSKDNRHVFHDQDNPKECCVEVSDNQEPQQWMVDYNFLDENIDPPDGSDLTEFYSFRYPKKRKKATQEMINAWKLFVKWMAESNPQPKYEKVEIHNQEEFESASINLSGKRITIYSFDSSDKNSVHMPVDQYHESIKEYYIETPHVYGYTNEKLPEGTNGSFEAYTFRGYKCDEEIQKDYNPLIKDFTITTYATKYTRPIYQRDENGDIEFNENTGEPIIKGYENIDEPYTHDTYEYRMAKMLSECEDHLVMDSVIYHYLFIERHCMIDNVAKNTFWSTEDCQHWNLIKNYDNDTADGNDNNGKFTRSYGMECLDKLNKNTYVFNAHQSVWLNFINGLGPACEHIYKKLESVTATIRGKTYTNINAWSSQDYLQVFKDWQQSIPERCWIESYYRLYERPYEVYNEDMFLSMMEGGLKTHQRNQFETYQDYYMSSKYYGTTASSNMIIIRGSGDHKLGYKLPIQMYADCYVQAAIGSGQNPNIKIRTKRNEIIDLECPINNLNNTTFYLYLSQLYQKIGDAEPVIVEGKKIYRDINGFAPEQFSVSRAPKLRECVLGARGGPVNESLNQLAFENNDLLEKLYVSNCPKAQLALNLTAAPNLIKLEAINSGFTDIDLADGAPVTSIDLESPISLTLSNLNYLDHIEITDLSSLEMVKIVNIDKMKANTSKKIVDDAVNLQKYRLADVNWIIDDPDEINAIDNKIDLLEILLTKGTPLNTTINPVVPYPVIACLTGNLTITEKAYNSFNSFALQDRYTKYKTDGKYYPDLNFEFEGSKAKLYNITIYDGNNNITWKRKIIPGEFITEDFLMNGPYGALDMSKISKSASAAYIYSFNGEWEIHKDNQEIEIFDASALPNYYPLLDEAINENIILIPHFVEEERTYLIKFLDSDGSELVPPAYYPYKTKLTDIENNLSIIPYKDDSLLARTATYNFIGWGLTKNATIPLSKYEIANDQTFYPIFELVNDMRTIIHPEWFDYVNYTYEDGNGYGSDPNFKPIQGVMISPKKSLRGKITIPSTYTDEYGRVLPVVAIAQNFSNIYAPHTFTHIFCANNSSLYEIKSSAFKDMKTLRYFDFEQNTVRKIAYQAFQGCSKLENTSFSENLFYLGQNSFTGAGYSESPVTVKIPAKLAEVGSGGFSFTMYAPGSSLQIGDRKNYSSLNLVQGGVNNYAYKKFSRQDAASNPGPWDNVTFYSKLYGSPNDPISASYPNITVGSCFQNYLSMDVEKGG